MKVSEHWLREMASPPGDTAALVQQLTMQGLEVESVEAAAIVPSQVVVARVLEVVPHPNADRLRVCQVDVGTDVRQIVCGAPNVRAGGLYPAALTGATLPGGLTIRSATLRGVNSEGMLCSAIELGLANADPGARGEGLLELDAGLSPGTPIAAALRLDDQILDLKITPNRADCFSVVGVARDLAATTGVPFQAPVIRRIPAQDGAPVPVRVEDPAGSPVFATRTVRNLRPEVPSPLWLRERLRRSGLRSIHPVVDVTNLVMLELGQPLHAYDLDKLRGGLVVRRASAGERLELLTGAEVQLDEGVLVIADDRGAIGMAGIMGGSSTAVSTSTVNVLFEAAFFHPSVIAGRARRFSLQTDAATRFERGVDPTEQQRAIERATELLMAIAGGVPGPCQTVGTGPEKRGSVTLRRARLAQLLGHVVADTEIMAILQRLGMSVTPAADGWRVVPPAFRFDLAIEADLIEEIARVHGYDQIPAVAGRQTTRLGDSPTGLASPGQIRAVLVQRGYQEAVTYSFVDRELDRHFSGGGVGVALVNPLSSELGTMRQSLWPGLIQAVRHNLDRQHRRVRLFELGVRFLPEQNGLREEPMIAAVAVGRVLPEQWGASSPATDFFDLKSDVEAMLASVAALENFRLVPDEHAALQPGRSARIVRGSEHLGWLGVLHPRLVAMLDLGEAPVLFEVTAEAFTRGRRASYQAVSRFPTVRRDIAVVVSQETPVSALLTASREAAGPVLHEVIVFDIFARGSIETGQKSVALGLILQETSRTLTDADADEIVGNVVQRLATGFGARIRQ